MAKAAASTPGAARPQRVQMKRSAGWKMPANTLKVDRTTRWGNPFSAVECGSVAAAVAQHGRWMRGEIAAPGAVEPPEARRPPEPDPVEAPPPVPLTAVAPPVAGEPATAAPPEEVPPPSPPPLEQAPSRSAPSARIPVR